MRSTSPRCATKKLRWSMAMDKTPSMRLSKRMLWRAFAAASLLAMAGCDHLHQDMGNQPKNLPLSPSGFFADGRSERAPVENTVARDAMVNDDLIVAKDSNNFPLPVNQALLERGEERYK